MATSTSVRRHGPLTIQLAQDSDSLVLHVTGDLDLATAPALEDALLHALDGGASSIVLDLRKVRYIDSTGLRVLLWGTGPMSRSDGRLHIRCGAPIRRVVGISGIEPLLPLADAS